jgi:hypothetical protein
VLLGKFSSFRPAHKLSQALVGQILTPGDVDRQKPAFVPPAPSGTSEMPVFSQIFF